MVRSCLWSQVCPLRVDGNPYKTPKRGFRYQNAAVVTWPRRRIWIFPLPFSGFSPPAEPLLPGQRRDPELQAQERHRVPRHLRRGAARGRLPRQVSAPTPKMSFSQQGPFGADAPGAESLFDTVFFHFVWNSCGFRCSGPKADAVGTHGLCGQKSGQKLLFLTKFPCRTLLLCSVGRMRGCFCPQVEKSLYFPQSIHIKSCFAE